jgi:hypothetical protein
MQTGKGVGDFTVRQFLNICYATIAETFQGSNEEGGETAEDQLKHWEEQIGLRHNPDDDAKAALRAFQIAKGIDPDAKKADVEKDIPWWEKGQEF